MSNHMVAGFRLSTQQERLWHQHADKGSPFWAECELLVEGSLDSAKLKAALRDIVSRHEILRTVFRRQSGLKVPFQVILESPDFVWQTADLTGLNDSAQRDEVRNLISSRESGIDLEQGPTLHVVLVTLARQKHALVLSLPSLCADLRSMQNLANEIGRLYADGLDESDEVMQYADLAEWQQELLASDETKPGRDYWRDYCRKIDFSAIDSVLSQFEKKSAREFSPDLVVKQVEHAQFASPPSESLQDFLLACWHVFLLRMTGRPGVTIGCQFDGRGYSELANTLGVLRKYLPLESTCPDGTSFNNLLEQVQYDTADFRNWQDSFSWGNVRLAAGLEQGLMLPLVFDFAELPSSKTFGDLKFTTVRQEVCCERFQLKLSARRQVDRLWLEFHFDSSCLDRSTVERWSTHFLTLLKAAVADPRVAANRLPLLDAAERHRLLVEWNQTAADYPRDSCIHQLFEAQVAQTPDLPALRYEDECLTYRQLNEQSNQLAHYLRSQGVGADSLVGLCIGRSTTMMVAVLATLKAGGAYVPLSADHPKPRLMQQLAGVSVLLTEGRFECLMPPYTGPVILLDRHRKQWSGQPTANPQSVTGPENFAYVIYTSGSTGTPKGVAVRHRNLVNYTSFIQRRLDLERYPEPLRFATVSTLGADLGNTCIYPSLLSGGCLHIIGQDVAADSQRLREYMTRYPVDVLKIVPSHLLVLLNSGGGREVLPRKHLVMGGEALTIPLMEKLAAANGSCEVLNHYGPTETTVGSLTLRLKDYDWKNSTAQTIPIGRPIANTRAYILDTQDEPVPVGVAGELYIAGEGVTAGYINQPERTAERFLPDRFGPDTNAKMYRTGDLVRYCAEGEIEFLGRADDQVKIRGFRIELGEIESVLLRHRGVKQAAVLAVADARCDKSLVGYVVGAASSEELRSYLHGQLPDYMMPSAIIPMPKFPLNANGKIDRQALPKPEDVQAAQREPVSPRTPSEEIILAIWGEVLRRDGIGVEDNFFEIGGHSLLATQIASRLREHFRIAVAVRTVFEAPTIAELARRLDRARREEEGLVPPPIKPFPRDGAVPLSFAQERLWVLDQMEPNNPFYNISRSLRLKGTLQTEAVEKALNEIVRRHESQRTTFALQDGHPVQKILPFLTIPLELQDLSDLPESEREDEARRIAGDEATRPFDLAMGPLLRARLLRLGNEHHVLLLNMHHIISDAWSADILLQELGVLYDAFCGGRPSPLPELAVQYADYAVHERQWLQGEVLEKQLAFWRKQLKRVPPVLELPLDRPRPSARSFQGACEMLRIPQESLRTLNELARQNGATLFMILMAGFQALLYRYSGQDQIVVGTDLANRTTPETERMIGFFINLMAVRTDLSGNPTFRELLRRVREGLLGSYAHQEVPFLKIVQDIQPERSATHNPIVQVLFVMQNIPRANRELAGLQMEPFEVPVTTSKFDMAVFVAERAGELIGYWVYSTELFDQPNIQRMVRHFGSLLQSAVSQPDARLSALSMLSPEEADQHEAEKKQRKQSQLKKLKTTSPTSVKIATDERANPSS
jgi:amino acid adenylation domain-containing protein